MLRLTVAFLFAAAVALIVATPQQCEAQARMTTEEIITKLIENVPPLQNPLGGALPIRGSRLEGWLPEDDDQAREVLRALDARGLAMCARITPGNEDVMAEALRMGHLQEELGLQVGVHASRAMYGFFNGDESTAHLADDGTPFFDDTFSSRKMGCPFRLEHRKDDIKAQFRSFLDLYREAGIDIDFLYLDWEIDGPIEWNGAWEHSKRCTVCRENVPDIENFNVFQDTLREIRSDLQRECCVEVVQEYAPDALIGNYATNPHGGTRYWYDYFEVLPEGAPFVADQQAKYRRWYHEFEPSGYTFANPVVYTWYATWSWYPAWDNDDYRWFYNLLKVGTNAGRHTPQDVPLITWLHWHTTAPPKDAPPVPQMSEWAYQELIWHLYLRGSDGLMMWCTAEETVKEITLMTEVLDEVLAYREFVSAGEPVIFHVPNGPGTVVSALRLGDRLLVRRTDFTDSQAPVRRRVGDRMVEIPRMDGEAMLIDLKSCPIAD
ncbi:MAG: hypothetical protein GX131_20345 [candidate division WS1 bacterium]|jgi:hypothetical protein|nr:hypothetical protein [candidate division WS1 bacterium]